MFGKFLIIALVCVSVAQVRGDALENAINNALRRVKILNENGQSRYDEAVEDAIFKSQLLDSGANEFIERANRVQENSRQTLRNIAALTEQKAKDNNRPESVFRCIRRYEENANNDIDIYTRKFEVDMERLRGTKQENLDTAAKTYNNMDNALETRYEKAVRDIQRCQNIICVNTASGSFSTYMNSMLATITRVEGQINTIMTDFQRDANNYFINSNRQISMIRSAAVRNIKNCYFRGENAIASEDCQDCQDSQDSQEV